MDVIHKADGFMGWHTESLASPVSTCGIRFGEENCGKYENKTDFVMPI